MACPVPPAATSVAGDGSDRVRAWLAASRTSTNSGVSPVGGSGFGLRRETTATPLWSGVVPTAEALSSPFACGSGETGSVWLEHPSGMSLSAVRTAAALGGLTRLIVAAGVSARGGGEADTLEVPCNAASTSPANGLEPRASSGRDRDSSGTGGSSVNRVSSDAIRVAGFMGLAEGCRGGPRAVVRRCRPCVWRRWHPTLPRPQGGARSPSPSCR